MMHTHIHLFMPKKGFALHGPDAIEAHNDNNKPLYWYTQQKVT